MIATKLCRRIGLLASGTALAGLFFLGLAAAQEAGNGGLDSESGEEPTLTAPDTPKPGEPDRRKKPPEQEDLKRERQHWWQENRQHRWKENRQHWWQLPSDNRR